METPNDRRGSEESRPDTLSEKLAAAIQNQHAGRLDSAENLCREILRDDPQHAGALNCLGVLAEAQGKNEQAKSHFEEALRLRPDYTEAYSNLGANRLIAGQFEQARVCFERDAEHDRAFHQLLDTSSITYLRVRRNRSYLHPPQKAMMTSSSCRPWQPERPSPTRRIPQ